MMPFTTTYKRGQVVVVDVPFSNRTGVKPRPALVVSTEQFHRELLDIIVCPSTANRGTIGIPDEGIALFTIGERLDSGIRVPFGSPDCLRLISESYEKPWALLRRTT